MGEYFSFSPAPIPKKDGNYRGKDIEDWGWKDFQNYFDDKYVQKLNKKPPPYNVRSQKNIVESAFKLRGKEVFRAMIDWAFENKTKYPQWNSFSIGLVCGKHGWANMIAEQAEKIVSARLDYYDDTL